MARKRESRLAWDGDPAKAVEAVSQMMRLSFFKPNRIQEPFFRLKNRYGRTPKRRIVEAGEKCITFDTKVETLYGDVPVGRLYERGDPFFVWAWDGKKRVVAKASAPFKKAGLHECFRIELSDGRWLEGADRHRVLCDGHWYFLEELYGWLHDPLASTSERGLSVHASGDLRSSGTTSDSLERYSRERRRYDELPPSEKYSGLEWIPSPSGARLHTPTFGHRDDPASGRASSLCTLRDRPASERIPGRFLNRISRSLTEAAYRVFQWSQYGLQFSPQPSIESFFPARSSGESVQHLRWSGSGASSSESPKYGVNVVSFHPIAVQEVYDFTVEKHHNYYAGGLINHNTGKTRGGVAEDIAHAIGFRPWLLPNDPDYLIRIPVPNHGLLGCETMGQSVEAKIEPELRLLIPEFCAPEWKNDSTGALKHVTLRYDFNGKQCGSTIHLRSYNQQADTFRGIDPHWVHWDEPPPQDILKAVERGKVVTNAPSWFTMTPLKEAYIFDLFCVNAFTEGGSDEEIATFKGSMWDNCQDYCRDCDCYIPENDPVNLSDPHEERPVDWCPICGKIMGFVSRAGILEYAKLYTDPEERDAHLEGKWAHLSGLVYKSLSRDTHLYEDFEIPKDWMRVEVVDPHDARPTRWLFAAISPEDITINGQPANRVYINDYLLADGNVSEIARSVTIKRAQLGYSEPEFVILDAKFGSKSIKTMAEETCWEEELYDAGIKNIRLSHSNPGDVSIGHKRVKEYLAPHHSKLRGKAFPGMMFAKNATSGTRGPMQDMSNYQWKPGTDKPEEAYKDFCDTVRYLALEQPAYQAPGHNEAMAQLLAMQREENQNHLTYGMRLANAQL